MDLFHWAFKPCSTAHKLDNIDAYFDMASNSLKAAGYSAQRILLDGVWKDVSIDI